MKTLVVTMERLEAEGRWDIDYHLPAEGIKIFPPAIVQPVSNAVDIVRTKRDPTKNPDNEFQYIDIASIDVVSGSVVNPQELTGAEAPSRARKVVHAYDIIISTCRPTRGAIAVIPEKLHGQICSTGFSVIRAREGVNPFYLHFALRLPSTLEQFRKWSTGSSYPAILDDDVLKTVIPLPDTTEQDRIARIVRCAAADRDTIIREANQQWDHALEGVVGGLAGVSATYLDGHGEYRDDMVIYSVAQVAERVNILGPVDEEPIGRDEDLLQQLLLFENGDEEN